MSEEKTTPSQTNSQTTPWTAASNIFLPALVAGIFSGALLGTVFDPPIALLIFLAASLAVLGVVVVRKNKTLILFLSVLLFLFAGLLGASRAFIYNESIPDGIALYEETKVRVIGIIIKAPDKRETQIRLTVSVEEVNGALFEGRVLVSTDRFSDASYGDRVLVEGILKTPSMFETDTGRIFDYQKFLLAHKTTHTISFANVSVLENNKGNAILAVLLGIKDSFVRNIETMLPDPEAPLLSGLLLGERQSMGPQLYESFRKAGVVHMIVLSGYNVSLVVKAILKITENTLPRLASFSVAGIGIVAFALMTGASETTVRASLMAGILIFAQVARRPHHALRALLIAGALMVLINPYLLLYDLSFQLSFLATAGIILFSDTFAKHLAFLPQSLGIRSIGGATIAATLAVLPILTISLGNVSVVSPVANVLVLGAVPWAMLFGFIALVLAYVGMWLAYPFVITAYVFLKYILIVSVWFGNMPFASITIPPSGVLFASLLLFAMYGLLVRLFMKRDLSMKKSVLKVPPRSSF